MTISGGGRLGIRAALLVAVFGCVHCGGDDDAPAPSLGDGGEPTSAGSGGTAPAGGTAPGIGGAPDISDGGDSGASQQLGGAAGSGTQALAGAGGGGGTPNTTPEGEHYGFVFDSMEMPTSNADAVAVGFDLNGDDVVDNTFGRAMARLSVDGLDINGSLSRKLATGDLIMLADLQAASLTDARAAGFLTYFGDDPQPAPCSAVNDCGHHLDGTGAFEIVTDSPAGVVCRGDIASSVFVGLGGELPMLGAIGEQNLSFVLHDARVELSAVNEDGFVEGRIGGAVDENELELQVFPAVHATLAARVAADCTGGAAPACGCADPSTGRAYVTLLDENDDCVVSLTEVKANGLIQSLFEVDLDRDGDQIPDAMSYAVAVTGKKAAFDRP
jgi:hypothetical protein